MASLGELCPGAKRDLGVTQVGIPGGPRRIMKRSEARSFCSAPRSQEKVSNASGLYGLDNPEVTLRRIAERVARSTSAPAGTVVATEPKAGASISKGQSVSLHISLGNSSQPVTIPDTVNMGLSDAENTLQQAGLAYRVVFTSTSSSNARPNTVLYQDPPGGVEGRTGDTVTLTVLSPGSQFPVPDVTGQSALDAASLLGQSGLQVDNTQGSACSNVHAEGLVVATSPAIGSLVVSNDKIQLILSTGYCDVVVPDVTGMTKALATTTMQQQGLVVTMVTLVSMSTDCSNGTVRDQVMSQTLSPGSQHPYKTEVKLNWCP